MLNTSTLPMPATLPIHEHFYSFQGEGVHLGHPAYFIRTQGCPIRCPWCDSAGTWHPKRPPTCIEHHTPEALAKFAQATRAQFAVITGGEPTIHDLTPLAQALHDAGLAVHLETSGAFRIRGQIDWITLSPKTFKMPLRANVSQAHEIKLIIQKPEDITFWLEYLAPFQLKDTAVWLHPEWSQAHDRTLLQAIAAAVQQHGRPLRAGYQLHKLYHVR